MEFGDLQEFRFVQESYNESAVDGLQLNLGYPGPPANKIWVVLGMDYHPDAAETRIINIVKTTKTTARMGLLNPISLALNPAVATFIEQGMNYVLLPGEYVTIIRDDHTAGSKMLGTLQYVEYDLPLYTYDEPQIVRRQERALSSVRSRIGSGGGSRGGGGALAGPIGPGVPGRGGPQPA